MQLITNNDLAKFNDEKQAKKKLYDGFEYRAKGKNNLNKTTKLYEKWVQLNQIPVIAQFAHLDEKRASNASIALLQRTNRYIHLPFNYMNAMTNSQEIINRIILDEELKNQYNIHYAKANYQGKLEKFDGEQKSSMSVNEQLMQLKYDKLNITFTATQSKLYHAEYHVSIFVSYKLNGKINIFNIDAYNNRCYVYNYDNDTSLTKIIITDGTSSASPLQAASWNNMNCGVYTANIANIIMKELSEVSQDKWLNIIKNQNTYRKIRCYFAENASKSLTIDKYHNEIRSKVADQYMKNFSAI